MVFPPFSTALRTESQQLARKLIGDGWAKGLCKDIDVVRSHSLLREEDLFRAVDDEMSFRIVWALIEVEQLLVSKAVKDTVCGPEHDRNLHCTC